MCVDGNSVFQMKRQCLCSKILELGADGDKESKFLVENVILTADPDLAIHYATFVGLR